MDLNITQVGCTFKDSYGVIQGSMTGNQATVESTFTELKIQQCSGAIEDANLFVLLCESGCTSEYSLKQ